MQRLVVQVETRPDDAVPQENQPLIPFQSQNVGTLLMTAVFRTWRRRTLHRPFIELTMISNRGVKVYLDGMPATFS